MYRSIILENRYCYVTKGYPLPFYPKYFFMFCIAFLFWKLPQSPLIGKTCGLYDSFQNKQFFLIECTARNFTSLSSFHATSNIRCHMKSSCDSISCCVYIAEIKRHALVNFELDVCDHTVNGSIEQLQVSTDLMNYVWGESIKWLIYNCR